MAQKVTAGMPPDIELGGGYTLRLTAVDWSSGAVLTTVNVSNLAMLVRDLTGGDGSGLVYGPFMLVPTTSP